MSGAASRIVLDPSLRTIIDAIQAKTKTPSPSAAIALMVSRYGRHLLETWELDPTRYTDPNPVSYYSSTQRTTPNEGFAFNEAIEL